MLLQKQANPAITGAWEGATFTRVPEQGLYRADPQPAWEGHAVLRESPFTIYTRTLQVENEDIPAPQSPTRIGQANQEEPWGQSSWRDASHLRPG